MTRRRSLARPGSTRACATTARMQPRPAPGRGAGGRAGGSAAGTGVTPTEGHLLGVLLRHPGKLLGQQYLLTEVWGPGYASATGNLRLYMAQLRRKLEPDPARPRWLLTEPGMGYRFQPDPDTTSAGDASAGQNSLR